MKHVCSLVLGFLFICCLHAQTKYDFVPCQEMPDLMQKYQADYRAIQRFYTPADNNSPFSYRGGDGDGADSPEKRERLVKLYNEYLQKLSQLNFKGLSQECKVDYILFKRDLDEQLKVAAIKTTAYEKVKTWMPFADKIFALEKLRRRGTQQDGEKIAREWFAIGNEVKALQAKLKNDKSISFESTYDAADNIENIRKSAASVYQFYNGYDPLFTWWAPQPYKTMDSLLKVYAAAFKKKRESIAKPDSSGIVGQPVGRDELARQLKYEMIPYSPEELIEIANKEFAWCDAEMLKASREMGFGDDWKAAMEKVKNTFVPAGKQPEAILKLYNESIDFLKKNDLITIPPLAEETWGMYMMSPERQLVNPFFLGGQSIIISYPTNTMDEDAKLMSMRGNNPHFSRATVHHELIAGHNLEFFMNDRYRTYRDFSTPFWVEGWSLYWELLLWDLKFPQSPEDRIGMLFWHMHRCARIIFSLNYHMGKWTPQQCIDFLVDRVNHERANAEGEVRRSFEGRYPPLYQLAYLTGGRQFYALKNELVDSGKMSYKQFHDAIMHLNAMPVEMIRAILTNQPLDKDFATQWKFYK
ncbi:DUF885 family protein [Foetidibacter luteolus]|uniref:DUF885 family protein n=1 Tax=Foetidibacter luteolus TaxID=2608880 RepID=UPI00129ADAE1|nr:DUF885 family protein [Foetidibacter luteolus]